MALERVYDIHRGDPSAASVISVHQAVTKQILQKDSQHSPRFFVDQSGDTLHTATTSETANGGLCDSLDVVAQDHAVTLGVSLSESFASFTVA